MTSMACSLGKLFPGFGSKLRPNVGHSIRNGHHLRGKPPGVARSLKQRIEELNYKDPTLNFRVDIGLPPKQISRTKQLEERLKILNARRWDPNLERLSREKRLLVNMDEVNEDWIATIAKYQIKEIADHYGVYQDLFGDAYFIPEVPLEIQFYHDDAALPVYFGNTIKPADASLKPDVHYECDDTTLWTLILTNPDGHFTDQNQEYLHWFVGNIPGNKISEGETIVEYLQPFPPRGTGYHRHIFILYKQEKKLDFSQLRKRSPCLNLQERTFNNLEFYRERQDDLTAGGVAFFQSDWDTTLTDFYQNILNMKEPIFEYDFPPPYITEQRWFPIRQPFNLYMDKYRDPKQINKEFLIRKLKNVHPFKCSPPPLTYPNAVYFEKYIPSWLKLEIRKSRLKWGRINDIE